LSDGGTPGHIPNPAVKAVSADGTWRATSWESRSLPRDFFCLKLERREPALFHLNTLVDPPDFSSGRLVASGALPERL